jgi:hypothetical protein
MVSEDSDIDVPQRLFGVWGWSPDDTSFAYFRWRKGERASAEERATVKGRLVICEALTGRDLAEFEVGFTNQPMKVVWLTPQSLVWVGSDARLRWIQKDSSGGWSQTEPYDSRVGYSSVAALSEDTIAWNDTNSIRTLKLGSSTAAVLYRLANKRLVGFSYSRATREFLLQASSKEGDSLWQLAPDYSSPEHLTPLKSDLSIANAQWINAAAGSYAYLSRKSDRAVLTVHGAPRGAPTRLFANGNAISFTPTADSKQVFIEAMESNDLAEALWQYDTDSKSLRRVVGCSDKPARCSKPVVPVHEFVTLSSGRKVDMYLYRPANFDRHARKRYPLVICYTPYVATLGQMAQVCAPALANGGAYVAIVSRPGWEGRLTEWGDDVMGFYNYLAPDASIDRGRVFVLSRSRECESLWGLLARHPEPWKGAIVLNGWPADFPPGKKVPKILFDVEERGASHESLARFQETGLQRGVPVEYYIHKDAPHDYMARSNLRTRMQNMVHFVFDE